MKPRILILLGLLIATQTLFAQFAINWFTIDGGGGTSTGGNYSLTGTIGQPDAGQMSGGNYVLTGGFWSLASVIQTPDAPRLYVRYSVDGVEVFWDQPAEGWVLQKAASLSAFPVDWREVSSDLYSSDAAYWYFTIAPRTGRQYFRLHKSPVK